MTHQDIEHAPAAENRWLRGLWMLIFIIFFGIAETLLGILALVQFIWLIATGGPNRALRDFGAALGHWMQDVARFQCCASDDKPFPWGKWPSTEAEG